MAATVTCEESRVTLVYDSMTPPRSLFHLQQQCMPTRSVTRAFHQGHQQRALHGDADSTIAIGLSSINLQAIWWVPPGWVHA